MTLTEKKRPFAKNGLLYTSYTYLYCIIGQQWQWCPLDFFPADLNHELPENLLTSNKQTEMESERAGLAVQLDTLWVQLLSKVDQLTCNGIDYIHYGLSQRETWHRIFLCHSTFFYPVQPIEFFSSTTSKYITKSWYKLEHIKVDQEPSKSSVMEFF